MHIIDYGVKPVIVALARIGFFAERVVLVSRDPAYPDVLLYTFQPERLQRDAAGDGAGRGQQ